MLGPILIILSCWSCCSAGLATASGSILVLYLPFGGDNLGIYIPLFASIDWSQLVLTLFVYYALLVLMLGTAYKISEVRLINAFIEKYERWIVSLVFVALGLYIMLENETVGWLFS